MRKAIYALGLLLGFSMSASAAPVLMISIDGLRPGEVLHAEERGLKLPNLRAFMVESAYATGVRNVMPTVTHPDHVTLVTGVWPSEHGITNNSVFDPEAKNLLSGYYFASDIKVPTLWDAVHASGSKVASLYWPASAGARSVDYLIPAIGAAHTEHDVKLTEALSSPGLVAELTAATGVTLLETVLEVPEADAARAQYAAALIAAKHPLLTLFHVVSSDHYQHIYGPGSVQAHAALEKVDAIVGDLVARVRKSQPDMVIAIVSDHGFQAITKATGLARLFVDAGLITLDPKTKKIASWEAMPWSAGGTAAIMLARPDDKALKAKVWNLLKKLQADKSLEIARVVDAREAARIGAGKGPSFWVEFNLGTMVSATPSSPITGPAPAVLKSAEGYLPLKGMHGYFPDHPEMWSSFFIAGPGIKKGSLGDIDMRDIAPTLAAIMNVKFTTAAGKRLFKSE